MERITTIERTDAFRNPVVTLGNFDGVHLGHQKIFTRLTQRARELRGQSIVYTFEPHPVKVLYPQQDVPLIISYEERASLIEGFGVDVLICARFDMEFASQGAREFVEKVLHQRLGVREVLVGYDYAFGRGREGNTDFLHAMGQELGFRVEVVSPVMMDGEAVSSSRVRKAVQGGEVALANRMLGREFASEGVVQRGHGRGKGLGYPTANLSLETELTPKPGVYVVRVYLPGVPQPLGGMANLGTNPTFSDQRSSFEVHILDFQGELYGQRIRVGFVDRLRDERRFPSPRALVEQLRLDEEASRSILCGKQ